MGDRDHLHICRHCGTVMATSSSIAPRKCVNCSENEFSMYRILPELISEPNDGFTLTWRLYGQYSKKTGVKETVITLDDVPSLKPTVQDALLALVDAHDGLAELVFDENGALRESSAILHNHHNVYNEPSDLESELDPNDELALLPRIT